MLELSGVAPEGRPKQARRGDKIETELAKRARSTYSRPRPEQGLSQAERERARLAAPSIDWARFFRVVGAPPVESLNVDFPPFMRALESVVVQPT